MATSTGNARTQNLMVDVTVVFDEEEQESDEEEKEGGEGERLRS